MRLSHAHLCFYFLSALVSFNLPLLSSVFQSQSAFITIPPHPVPSYLFVTLFFFSPFASFRPRTERSGARVRPALSVRCHPSHQNSPTVSDGRLPGQRKQRCSDGQRRQSHALGAQSLHRQGACQPQVNTNTHTAVQVKVRILCQVRQVNFL